VPNKTRSYHMQRRADSQQQTRRRITESAVELHGTLGPSRTTVSAVAEQARVRRSTVYRHFPDEKALFAACSAHWREANPTPDLGHLAAIEDPDERLKRALPELYAFYRRNERMLDNLVRDEALMPVVRSTFEGFRAYLAGAREILMAGRRGRKRQRAAVGHALAFATWRSLAREQELDDRQAADLMCRLVAAS
jgi:AcrR family transcriptional regulator